MQPHLTFATLRMPMTPSRIRSCNITYQQNTTNPVWLPEGMQDQGVPTGNPEYDEEFLN